MRRTWLVVTSAVLLASLSSCSGDDEPAGDVKRQGGGTGVTDGATSEPAEESGDDLGQLQDDAASAADEVTSGVGLRVENRTGDRVVLTLPDGDQIPVEAGKDVVILRPCADRLPVRAEDEAGDLIAVRKGPCRQTDTWVLSD